MIKRLQKIKNVGKFKNCSASGCEFKNNTIIFGLNTHGKSTLTAIFRSLQKGNRDLIIGRKTLGTMGEIYIEIDFDNERINDKYKFENNDWNKLNSNIIIFDSKFISDNIFEGENISHEHQKNLNSIIIGRKGQDLSNEIISLQKQSEDFANAKRELTNQFNLAFPKFDISIFMALPVDLGIDEKINKKAKEIKLEKEKESNIELIDEQLEKINSIKLPIEEKLNVTLEVKAEEIERHIKSHFITEKGAEKFLNDGINFLKEKEAFEAHRICVFCGHPMDSNAELLIQQYNNYFKGRYTDIQKNVNDSLKLFRDLNLEAILGKINSNFKTSDLEFEISEETMSIILDLKKKFEKELEMKQDLNYQINFEPLTCLSDEIGKIKNKLTELKKDLKGTPTKTITDLEFEKRILEVTKKRHEENWIDFCEKYEKNKMDSERIRNLREEKRKDLDEYSSNIFDTHKETINCLCSEMCADFEIEEFKPLSNIRGTSERIFSIKFFGRHTIDISDCSVTQPNFQNTLSESDKRLLAFAFFISLLKHDQELDKKIIIFDDPISSFDRERQRKTIHLLTDVACKFEDKGGNKKNIFPRQKIILTHEDRFAKELLRLMQDVCTLRIKEKVEGGQKESTIVHSDFNNEFPDDEIISRIERLKCMLESRSFVNPFEVDCREVLENIFKRKYYFELKDEIATRKSVRTFVVKLKESKINDFEEDVKYKKFIRLCDDLNIELHDNNSVNSIGDKESIIKDFFECLRII